jgi:F-type H+-transporting ATPase subunit b
VIRISIDWTLLLQAANFFVLLGLLQWLLFRPLRAVMQRRRQEIEGSLGRVRDLEDEIAGRQAGYSELLESVRENARQQREAVRAEVTEQQLQLLSAAREEATGRQRELEARLAVEEAAAATALRAESARLAGAITHKIAGRAL